jgi:hypothetical protein
MDIHDALVCIELKDMWKVLVIPSGDGVEVDEVIGGRIDGRKIAPRGDAHSLRRDESLQFPALSFIHKEINFHSQPLLVGLGEVISHKRRALKIRVMDDHQDAKGGKGSFRYPTLSLGIDHRSHHSGSDQVLLKRNPKETINFLEDLLKIALWDLQIRAGERDGMRRWLEGQEVHHDVERRLFQSNRMKDTKYAMNNLLKSGSVIG